MQRAAPFALAVVLMVGCFGAIDRGLGSEPAEPGATKPGGAQPGSAGPSSTSQDGPPAGACPAGTNLNDIHAGSAARRLTRFELERSLTALLGVPKPDLSRVEKDGTSQLGLNKDGATQSFLGDKADRYYDAFEGVADQFVAAKSHAIFACEPLAAQTQIDCVNRELARLLRRAWRRPAGANVAAAMALFSREAAFKDGVRAAVLFTLLAPQFLHVYLESSASGRTRPLDGFELAERLSFLIGNQIPDEALLARAESGGLQKAEVLRAELARLLGDRKMVGAFLTDFTGQWLGTERLEDVTKEMPKDLPSYSTLAPQMRAEVAYFVEDLLRKNRGVADIFAATHSVITKELARLYGVTWTPNDGELFDEGRTFSLVKLPEGERRGPLTLVGVLTAMSDGANDFVRVIQRGHFMTKKVLCRPPPAPPPDIPEPKLLTGSVRERLRMHEELGSACAGCHMLMDPLGLALHNFDPVGRFRTIDAEKYPIDPSGSLDGQPFRTAPELMGLLARSEDVGNCFLSHLASYAVARTIDARSSCAAQWIRQSAAAKGGGMRELLAELITSDLFRTHQGESP